MASILTSIALLVLAPFNALLFLLLGVEMIAVPFHAHQTGMLIAAIPLVLVARFAVVLPSARAPTLAGALGMLNRGPSCALFPRPSTQAPGPVRLHHTHAGDVLGGVAAAAGRPGVDGILHLGLVG